MIKSSATKKQKKLSEIFQKMNDSAKQAMQSNLMPARLFRGELSLNITFWIFTLSLPLLGHLVFSRLVFPCLDIASTMGTTILACYGSLMICYTPFIAISLYRAAGKHEKMHGGNTAKTARAACAAFCILGILLLIYWYAVWSMSLTV